MGREQIALVLGIVTLFGLVILVASFTGYGGSVYLFQNGSTPLTGDWDTGSQIITIGSGVSDWYDPNWIYRKSITIDSDDVDEVLTDFPVLVYLDSDRVNWSYVQDDLDDLRFISNDNETVLDYEIESYVVNVDAWIWINQPSVSNTSDTWFWMYWGNDAAASGENIEDVWDDNFVMVQHMVDDDTSSILDSTQYDNDGSKLGADEPIETDDGIIDAAQDLDGSDDDVEITSPTVLDVTDNFTFEMWINHAGSTATQFSLYSTVRFKQAGFEVYKDNRDTPRIQLHSAGASKDIYTSNVNLIPSGTWYYVVITYDTSLAANNLKFFIDGSSVATGQGTYNVSLGANIQNPLLGASYLGQNNFDDLMDETRISNSTRVASWFKASYESGIDDLLTFGSEVSIGGRIIFRDGDLYITSSEDGHLELGADGSIDLNALVEIFNTLDMNLNYIYNSTYENWLHFDIVGGAGFLDALHLISGSTSQDRRIVKLIVGVHPSPAANKWVNCSISDGTNFMWVNLTGADTHGYTTTGAFDLDVSTEDLTVQYVQTAGGSTNHVSVIVQWYFKENE